MNISQLSNVGIIKFRLKIARDKRDFLIHNSKMTLEQREIKCEKVNDLIRNLTNQMKAV